MKKLGAFIAILLIGFGVRIYDLGNTPPSPDWDEAALGYNAYSIGKTGRDEYGKFLPFSIRSFDDYKPPLYVYLAVPSVALFGLSVWSTRLPSVLMGVLAIVGVYVFTSSLFSGQKKSRMHTIIPLLSSLLLAISPWHIQFSRIAFEANIGITCNIWAAAFFLLGLKDKRYFMASAAVFGFGLYAYHSERVFIPLLALLLGVIYRKEVFISENKKILQQAILLGGIIILPFLTVLFDKSAIMRLKGTSSFSDQTALLSRNIAKLEYDQKLGDSFGMLLDNRRIIWVKTIISGYLSHFSLRWLFLTGDNPRHHAPGMGLLYIFELPFLFFGLYILSKNIHEKYSKILFGWLILSPIAAAPTTGLPHAIRTLVFLPSFQIITAIGIAGCLRYFGTMKSKNKIVAGIFGGLYGVFVLGNILYYLNMYFVHQNFEYSEYWQYGYRDVVAYAEKHKKDYDRVYVSTDLEQSYIFFLFYTKYDPKKYLAAGGTKSGSFDAKSNSFDAYVFKKVNLQEICKKESVLYIGTPSEIPHGNVMNYKFLNGKPSIELADCKGGAL